MTTLLQKVFEYRQRSEHKDGGNTRIIAQVLDVTTWSPAMLAVALLLSAWT